MANTSSSTVDRQRILLRLRRAAGQLRAVEQMVDSGVDCEAVVQQLSACRKALDKAFIEILACEMLTDGGEASDPDGHLAKVAGMLRRYG